MYGEPASDIRGGVLTRHAPRDTPFAEGKSTSKRVARRVRFRAVSWVENVLQNTGPAEFRQSSFLDFRRTPGYNFWFLTPGGVAQLGERLNGIQEVRGSIPLASMRPAKQGAPLATRR
jgi:hypothetical protein